MRDGEAERREELSRYVMDVIRELNGKRIKKGIRHKCIVNYFSWHKTDICERSLQTETCEIHNCMATVG